jgi:hypothetical protein
LEKLQKMKMKRKAVEVEVEVDVEVNVEVGLSVEDGIKVGDEVGDKAEVASKVDVEGQQCRSLRAARPTQCVVDGSAVGISETFDGRYIEAAVMDEGGQLKYLYRERMQYGKVPARNSDHPDAFVGIFALYDDSPAGPVHRTDLAWVNLDTNFTMNQITYLSSVLNVAVDIVHKQLALSWKCQTKYRIDVWDLDTNENVAVFDTWGSCPRHTTSNLYGGRLLVLDDKGSAFYCDVSTESYIFVKENSGHKWSCVHQTDDFARLLIAGEDSLKILDTRNGVQLLSCSIMLDVPEEHVSGVLANPENSLYFVFYTYGACVFDAVSLTEIGRIECGYRYPRCLGFYPDAPVIFILSSVGYMVWEYTDKTDEALEVNLFANERCLIFDSAVFNPCTRHMVWACEPAHRAFAFAVNGSCDSSDDNYDRDGDDNDKDEPERLLSDHLQSIYCAVPRTVLM